MTGVLGLGHWLLELGLGFGALGLGEIGAEAGGLELGLGVATWGWVTGAGGRKPGEE